MFNCCNNFIFGIRNPIVVTNNNGFWGNFSTGFALGIFNRMNIFSNNWVTCNIPNLYSYQTPLSGCLFDYGFSSIPAPPLPSFKLPELNFNMNFGTVSNASSGMFNFGAMFPNAFNFTFNMPNVNNNVNNNNGNTGNEVADGTSITVNGIDYSVFDRPDEIKKLRPEMQKKVELLYKYAKEHNLNLKLTSGYRSTEQQKQLYKQKLQGKKTCAVAAPGTSRHEFGCAVDLTIDGSATSPKLQGEFGKYAREIGLRQGLSFDEPWHFDVDPKTTPKGRDGKVAPASNNDSKSVSGNGGSSGTSYPSSYSRTPDADYAAIYNETYKGDYVNTGNVIHFRYDDANLGSRKAMKPAAKAAFDKMAAAMKKEIGLTLGYSSAYRGKSAQRQSLNNHAYSNNVSVMKNRFKSVAPVGYSEHLTGYACDITINGNNGGLTNQAWSQGDLKKAYNWLKKNAKKYGFEQSFTAGNRQGVIEEAWHWRYVGDADSQRVFERARKYEGII